MRHEIIFAPDAAKAYKELDARLRAEVRDAIEDCLRHDPTKACKSRIKRLRGLARPQYRLRVGEMRVYYDVTGRTVEVLAIVEKSRSRQWLDERGEPR